MMFPFRFQEVIFSIKSLLNLLNTSFFSSSRDCLHSYTGPRKKHNLEMQHRHVFQARVIVLGNSGVGKTGLFDRLNYNFNRTCTYSTTTTRNKPFELVTQSTIGMDFKEIQYTFTPKETLIRVGLVPRETTTAKLSLTDTSGQERFLAMTKNYARGADAILFVFDSSKEESLFALNNWLSWIKDEYPEIGSNHEKGDNDGDGGGNHDIPKLKRPPPCTFLVGAKSDLLSTLSPTLSTSNANHPHVVADEDLMQAISSFLDKLSPGPCNRSVYTELMHQVYWTSAKTNAGVPELLEALVNTLNVRRLKQYDDKDKGDEVHSNSTPSLSNGGVTPIRILSSTTLQSSKSSYRSRCCNSGAFE